MCTWCRESQLAETSPYSKYHDTYVRTDRLPAIGSWPKKCHPIRFLTILISLLYPLTSSRNSTSTLEWVSKDQYFLSSSQLQVKNFILLDGLSTENL